MKQFTLIIILFVSGSIYSQSENIYWLDHTLKNVKQRKSTYKMVVSPNESVFSVTTYDKEGGVFMKSNSLDPEGKILDGAVVYYYPTGKIESQGQYLKGNKVGLWKRFTPSGMEKAERVYNLYNAEIGAYTYVDRMPRFDKGIESFDEFLKLSFSKYVNPTEAKGKAMKLSFIINEKGFLTNLQVDNSCSTEIKNELVELLERMPAWSPGEKQGEMVRVFVEKNIYCK